MNNRYEYYLAEKRRRQEEIKFAEMYRLVKLAKNDSSAPCALKGYQRLFLALGAMMVEWGTRLQGLYTVPQQECAQELP